jgi:hypothetical protein
MDGVRETRATALLEMTAVDETKTAAMMGMTIKSGTEGIALDLATGNGKGTGMTVESEVDGMMRHGIESATEMVIERVEEAPEARGKETKIIEAREEVAEEGEIEMEIGEIENDLERTMHLRGSGTRGAEVQRESLRQVLSLADRQNRQELLIMKTSETPKVGLQPPPSHLKSA